MPDLTVAVDSTQLVAEGAGTRQLNVSDWKTPATGAATEATLAGLAKSADVVTLAAKVPDEEGTWDYRSGVSGSVTIPTGGRVIGIAAHATTAGSFTINGGNSIPVPANVGVDVAPRGNLTAPTLVFTGTDSYLVEFVT